ncbi:hypothetical protein [Hymenobacter metallicola]|uniref:Uncharacterized protein n=1 Tax=Hymenobacter metallicola TaxID=2563114 RepID=A0A4Z0QFS3_9BACT|nr:hypothetical protein [Hymenobacter metallicola]TGE28604.1 hypothetical protein E5K02_03820 [Hymenobacter metallicola]
MLTNSIPGPGFLLIADIYAAQGETFQAKATLNFIIENKFPVPEIIEGAKQRLAALSAADAGLDNPHKPWLQLRKKLADGVEIDSAVRVVLVAESYYIHQQSLGRASTSFEVVADEGLEKNRIESRRRTGLSTTVSAANEQMQFLQ